jgi:hypothetical protein
MLRPDLAVQFRIMRATYAAVASPLAMTEARWLTRLKHLARWEEMALPQLKTCAMQYR